jgi:O-antigen ligase
MLLETKIQRIPINVAVMTTIVVMPALMDPINLPKFWILTLGAGLTLATLSFNQVATLWQTPKKNLAVVTVVFVAALLISSVASAQGIFRTLIGVWGRNNGGIAYLALLVIFLSLASMNSELSSKYLVKMLTLLGITAAVYGLLQNSGIDFINWENPGNKIILTLGNSNFASVFLALTGIATLTTILQPMLERWKQVLLTCIFFIQLYLTKMSDSLQGLLVMLLGSAILLGLFLHFSANSFLKKTSYAWWGSLLTSGVLGALGLAGYGPLSNILNPNLRTLQDRYYHWVAAMNMIKDNLFFGVGIDSFGDYYRVYRTIEGVNFRTTAMSGTNNAHNTFMQVGATGGIILLGAYLTLISFTLYRAIVALKNSNNKVLVSGIFSIWIAFQVQSLVSIDQIGLVVWGWASAGCLVSLSYFNPREKPSKNYSKNQFPNKTVNLIEKKVIKKILIFIGLVPALLLIPIIQNELTLRNRVVDLVSSSSEGELAINSEELYAVALKSQQPELQHLTVRYLMQTKSDDLTLELALLSTELFPKSFESWDLLARIYQNLGQKENAIIARKMTIKLDPLNQEIKELLENYKQSN